MCSYGRVLQVSEHSSGPRTETLGDSFNLNSCNPTHFNISTFLSNAENLALPVGKEGQREDVVCSHRAIPLLSLKLAVQNLKSSKWLHVWVYLFTAGNAMLGGSPVQSSLQTGLPAGSGMQRYPPSRFVAEDFSNVHGDIKQAYSEH